MKWENLLDIVGNEAFFSSALLMAGSPSRYDIQLQLSRWRKAGKIIQLRRELYTLAKRYRKTTIHPYTLANNIKKASYVSLQSALSFYGLIPEYVPATTSMTTGRPEEFLTAEGTFIFRHIKKSFFYGYRQIELAGNQTAFIATPEKSLLDLVYITPQGDTQEYLNELRLQNTDNLNVKHLEELADKSGSAKLKRAVEKIINIMKEDDGREL